MGLNLDTANRYKDTDISPDEYMLLKERLGNPCRFYVIGRAMIRAKAFSRKEGLLLEDALSAVAANYGCKLASALKNMRYAIALDSINDLLSDFKTEVIEGKIRIGAESVIMLARMEAADIPLILAKLTDEGIPRREFYSALEAASSRIAKKSEQSVKDTPTYDPDTQITSVSYTIPSWIGVIDGVFMSSDLSGVSLKARIRFKKELRSLVGVAEAIIELIDVSRNFDTHYIKEHE